MEILGILVMIFLIIFAISYAYGEEQSKQFHNARDAEYKEFEDFFHKISDFNPTVLYIDLNSYTKSGIAIDESRAKVCVVKKNDSLRVERVISYKDILSSELYEDGETIVKTVRSSQIGGAVVGGLLLGGFGTVIGGLSGKKIQKNKINNLSLRVVVNDSVNPLLDVCFLNGETDKNSEIYKYVSEGARYWQARMDILIKRAEKEDDATLRRNETSTASLSDELRKLAELKNNGVLTDEEFNTLKEKMLT